MKSNKLFTLLLVFVLVFSTVGTVFAQDVTPTDTGDGEEGGDDEWTHPIIALFDAYFELSSTDGGEGGEGGEGDTSGGDSGGDTTGEEMSFGEEIGTYHESGMGFGLLANLLALAELSQESCSVEDGGDGGGEAVCGASLGELVDSFKSGSGLGQLYKDYGKPDKHGVGYLQQEVNKDEKNTGKPDYEVGDEVLVAFDEDTGEWDLSKKNNKKAVSATVVAVTETEDGSLMLELTVEGEGTIFLTIEEKDQGKPDKDTGEPDKDTGKPGYEVGDEVLVALDEDTGEWALVKKNNKNAVSAIVVDVTENEDGTLTLGLDIEGHGIIFLTIDEGNGKPDKDTGKPDKPDNPNKPDKP